jgi:glycosyltransferase involved in cell wall biosynthesis
MKVSIITTTYNSARTIRDTVLSVRYQSHHDVEHIIVDGSSTDNTLNLAGYFGHTGPLLSEPDKGIFDAMNKGVMMASGDIVGILNSDDFYSHAGVIEKVAEAFDNEDCDAVYGDLVYVDSCQVKKVLRKWIAGAYNKKLFYNGWMPPHPTFFVKKEVYEKYGLFNLDFKSSSDYELLLRFMLLKDIKVKYLPGVLVHMRAGGHSNSSIKNRLIAHLEDYNAWRVNGISPKWYTIAMKPLRKLTQYLIPHFPDYSNTLFFKNLFSPEKASNNV